MVLKMEMQKGNCANSSLWSHTNKNWITHNTFGFRSGFSLFGYFCFSVCFMSPIWYIFLHDEAKL